MAREPQPPKPPATEAGAEDVGVLIAHLSSDLAPVRRCWSPTSRLIVWIAVQVLVVLLVGLWAGGRADLTAKLGEGSFAVEIAGLVSAGVAFAALALLAAVPGRGPRRAPVVAGLAVFFAALGVAYAVEPERAVGIGRFAELGWPCAALTIAFASVPWAVLLAAQRRGAPLEPALAGTLAGCASLAVAAATLRTVCALDERWHLLVWHVGPVLLGAGVSLVVGLWWLALWRERVAKGSPSGTAE
jgi:hypothetical protein